MGLIRLDFLKMLFNFRRKIFLIRKTIALQIIIVLEILINLLN